MNAAAIGWNPGRAGSAMGGSVVRVKRQRDQRFATSGPIAGIAIALLLAMSSYGALLASVVYSLHLCNNLICRN